MTPPETRARNLLATELLKDGYHERAERVAAGNEFMSDEPAVRACVEAVGETAWQPIETAPDRKDGILIVDASKPYPAVGTARFVDGVWRGYDHGYGVEAIWPSPTHWRPLPAPPDIEAALALPSPVRQGEDGGGIGGLREELRVLMLEQPISGTRETYSDGFAQGLCHAIWRIDALPALSPVRESVLEEAAKVADDKFADPAWGPHYRNAAQAIAHSIRALKSDIDFTGHIDCPEDEGGRG